MVEGSRKLGPAFRGADGSMLVRWDRDETRHKSLRLLFILDARAQYSSGNNRVVADRSASVIIHSFSPASVW